MLPAIAGRLGRGRPRLAGAAALAPPSAPAQGPCAEGFSSVLHSVDQFRVVSADLTRGTVSGGVFTTVAYALLVVLLFAELGAFLRVSYSTNVVIDDKLDESLRIEYDISVFDLPCRYRKVGSWDKYGKDRFVTNKSFTYSTLDHWGGTAGTKYTEAEIADEAKELDSDWSASSDHFQHKDFQAAVTFHDYTRVNFYAEWWSHCRQFHPTWMEASAKISEKMLFSDGDARQSTVKYLKMNCVGFQDNCKKAKIAAFPTLRLYKRDGSFEVFQQHRSVTNIVRFLTSSSRTSHLIVARHHMMFNEGCQVASQIHAPRVQGSFHLQAKPFGKMDLNPAITNVSHQACDYYCSGSCTTDCVQPTGTVALACECMSYPDSGEHNMFSVTPWSAAGYVKVWLGLIAAAPADHDADHDLDGQPLHSVRTRSEPDKQREYDTYYGHEYCDEQGDDHHAPDQHDGILQPDAGQQRGGPQDASYTDCGHERCNEQCDDDHAFNQHGREWPPVADQHRGDQECDFNSHHRHEQWDEQCDEREEPDSEQQDGDQQRGLGPHHKQCDSDIDVSQEQVDGQPDEEHATDQDDG
ncbi:unnamed protein product, partial [Prorocentrum cordatum]